MYVRGGGPRATEGVGEWRGSPWAEECWQIPEAGCDGHRSLIPLSPRARQVLQGRGASRGEERKSPDDTIGVQGKLVNSQ